MNITTENRTALMAVAGGIVLLLLLLILLLRTRSKSRKKQNGLATSASNSVSNDLVASNPVANNPVANNLVSSNPVANNLIASDQVSNDSPSAPTSNSFSSQTLDSDFPFLETHPDAEPEFSELFVVEDPLDGSGYLGTQINRQSSYISDFEIRTLINRYEDTWLSNEVLNSGFAEKSSVAGKMRTILYGEVEAISKSTTTFHPEISSRIEQANKDGKNFRLLAIDGLVYGVFLISI